MKFIYTLIFSLFFTSIFSQKIAAPFVQSSFEQKCAELNIADKKFIENQFNFSKTGWLFYKNTPDIYFKEMFETNNPAVFGFLLDNQLANSYRYLFKSLDKTNLNLEVFFKYYATRINTSPKKSINDQLGIDDKVLNHVERQFFKRNLRADNISTTSREYYYFLKLVSEIYTCPNEKLVEPVFIEDINYQINEISNSISTLDPKLYTAFLELSTLQSN